MPLPLPAHEDPNNWRAWDQFLEATPATGFMQSSAWARFRSTVGYDHYAVTLKDGGAVIGGALVGKWHHAPQRCLYYIQEGPVLALDDADAEQVFAAIMARLEQHRRAETATVSHLRIEPRWAHLPAFVQGFQAPAFGDIYREPRHTLCLDLRPPPAAILAQMKPKGRYNIRVAQRHGVTIVEDNSAQGLADFTRIQRATAQRQEIDGKSSHYFRDMLDAFAADGRLRLYFAQFQGQRIATAMVLHFGRRATYFFGGSLPEQRQVMAPYLLHFEIMCAARATGHEWYDLWGVAPPGALDHPWQAISEFKRKFGGTELSFVPTLDFVYDQAAYEHYAACQV